MRITQPTGTVRVARTPRVTQDLLIACATHMTPRDRHIIELVHEHDVLTTGQLTQLAFTSQRIARRRLAILHSLGLLARFRPWTHQGSHPWHWVLGPAGAHILAAEYDTEPAKIGYRPDRAITLATSQRRAHTTGRNQLLTALAHHARHTGSGTACELLEWRGERSCAKRWGEFVRPDAYARWRDGTRTTEFFLEYDTGTEPLHRLIYKLDGYTELAETTGIPPGAATSAVIPVLFHLPSSRRETHLHAELRDHPAGVPVATTTARLTEATPPGLAGPVWRLAGDTGDTRVRLADITNPHHHRRDVPAA